MTPTDAALPVSLETLPFITSLLAGYMLFLRLKTFHDNYEILSELTNTKRYSELLSDTKYNLLLTQQNFPFFQGQFEHKRGYFPSKLFFCLMLNKSLSWA